MFVTTVTCEIGVIRMITMTNLTIMTNVTTVNVTTMTNKTTMTNMSTMKRAVRFIKVICYCQAHHYFAVRPHKTVKLQPLRKGNICCSSVGKGFRWQPHWQSEEYNDMQMNLPYLKAEAVK